MGGIGPISYLAAGCGTYYNFDPSGSDMGVLVKAHLIMQGLSCFCGSCSWWWWCFFCNGLAFLRLNVLDCAHITCF